MAAYSVRARIDQIVTREVRLLIEGKDKQEVEQKAREALETFPRPVKYDPQIHRIVTTKADYWIPRNIDVVEIAEETDENN